MAQNMEPAGPAQKLRKYFGGCECRTVRYTIELTLGTRDPRTGSVWEHAAHPAGFRLVAGQEHLVGYQFAAEDAHHFFCVRCSSRVFSLWAPEGAAYYSVDLKSLYGHQLSAEQVQQPAAHGAFPANARAL